MTSVTWKVSDLPEAKSGNWSIRREIVSKADAEFASLRAIMSSDRGRGNYEANEVMTILYNGSTLVMSDSKDEQRDHRWAWARAKGRVLAHGLGIGMFANALLQKPEVEHLLIIEKSEDVIQMVAPHYKAKFGDRIEIRQGDAFTWKPARGERWNLVWHDIWNTITTDNLPEMHTLHRRFARRCDVQFSWCRERCEDYGR